MEKYVMVGNKVMNHAEKIHECFMRKFHVDLGDEKYAAIQNLEERWNAVVYDCFKCSGRKTFQEAVGEIISLMDKSCLLLGYGMPAVTAALENDKNIEDNAALKRREKARKELDEKIGESRKLISQYFLYELDVWIHAYFSSKYNDSYKTVNKKKKKIDKNIFNMEDGYFFPFKYREDDSFCGECVEKLYHKNVQDIFKTGYTLVQKEDAYSFDKEKQKIDREQGMELLSCNFMNDPYRLEIIYPYDLNFTRWSFYKICEYDKEISERKKLEDRILFEFVTNGTFVRNMAGCLLDQYTKGLEEYRGLFYNTNKLKSFSWQNYICMLYIGVYRDCYGYDMELDRRLKELFRFFNGSYKKINSMLKLLTAGLMYIRKPGDDEVFQAKCEECLNRLENNNLPLAEKIASEMGTKKKMRVTKDNRGAGWDYAFLQMETIRARTAYIQNQVVIEGKEG